MVEFQGALFLLAPAIVKFLAKKIMMIETEIVVAPTVEKRQRAAEDALVVDEVLAMSFAVRNSSP